MDRRYASLARREAEAQGKATERRLGVSRLQGKPGGRPEGKLRTYNTHKPVGAPTLRRDPTVRENLSVLRAWELEAKANDVPSINELPNNAKQRLERAGTEHARQLASGQKSNHHYKYLFPKRG